MRPTGCARPRGKGAARAQPRGAVVAAAKTLDPARPAAELVRPRPRPRPPARRRRPGWTTPQGRLSPRRGPPARLRAGRGALGGRDPPSAPPTSVSLPRNPPHPSPSGNGLAHRGAVGSRSGGLGWDGPASHPPRPPRLLPSIGLPMCCGRARPPPPPPAPPRPRLHGRARRGPERGGQAVAGRQRPLPRRLTCRRDAPPGLPPPSLPGERRGDERAEPGGGG